MTPVQINKAESCQALLLLPNKKHTHTECWKKEEERRKEDTHSYEELQVSQNSWGFYSHQIYQVTEWQASAITHYSAYPQQQTKQVRSYNINLAIPKFNLTKARANIQPLSHPSSTSYSYITSCSSSSVSWDKTANNKHPAAPSYFTISRLMTQLY